MPIDAILGYAVFIPIAAFLFLFLINIIIVGLRLTDRRKLADTVERLIGPFARWFRSAKRHGHTKSRMITAADLGLSPAVGTYAVAVISSLAVELAALVREVAAKRLTEN